MHAGVPQPGADGVAYPRPGLAWQILLTLFLATVVSYMDRGIIALLVPDLKAEFGLTDTQVSFVQGLAYSAFFALGSIPVGHLVDRFNRRNLIIFGVSFWSCATMACGLAHSYPQLLMARAGVGLGEACLIPAAYSIVADCFTPVRRGRAMSLIVAGTAVGGVLSNALGGLLLKAFSGRDHVIIPLLGDIEVWRFVFLVFGSSGAILVVLLLAFREPARRIRHVAVTHGRSEFFSYARRSPFLFIAVFAIVSLVFTASSVTSLWVLVGLVRVHHLKMSDAGILTGAVHLASYGVGSLVGGVIGDVLARVEPRYGRLNMWLYGIPLFAVGGIFLVWPGTLFAYMFGIWLISFVGAATAGAAYPIIYDIVPADLRGRSVAYCITIANLVSVGLGPTLPALLNDRVFYDEGMIHYSLMTVAVAASLIASGLTVAVRYRFARAMAALSG
jgi:MFS family permease